MSTLQDHIQAPEHAKKQGIHFPDIKAFIIDRFERRLPEGALTFQMQFGRNKEFGSEHWEQVRRVREQFNIDQLYIVHGMAAVINGVGVVVMGPHGVGKSTALRTMAKESEVKSIDDGFIIIGRDKDTEEFKIVSTGLIRVSERLSLISKGLRSFLGYKSAFLTEDDYDFGKKNRLGRLLQKAANLLGYLTIRPGEEHVENTATKLGLVISLRHKRDTITPGEIGDSSYRRMPFEEFLGRIPNVDKVVVNPPFGPENVERRIREEMRRLKNQQP
ncbi:MAG: hypothetical protein V1703_00080 [Candidatus Altiarchaeota archaeon]